MIKKVLVAVDGSENSDRALDFALDFSDKYNAVLTIINVSESSAVASVPPEIAAYTSDNMVAVARDLHKFHEDILGKSLVYAKEKYPNLSVNTNLREGNPASEIVAVAKDGAFDVVVVGHRGIGKFKGMFLGSISEKITRSLSCTVVLVR